MGIDSADINKPLADLNTPSKEHFVRNPVHLPPSYRQGVEELLTPPQGTGIISLKDTIFSKAGNGYVLINSDNSQPYLEGADGEEVPAIAVNIDEPGQWEISPTQLGVMPLPPKGQTITIGTGDFTEPTYDPKMHDCRIIRDEHGRYVLNVPNGKSVALEKNQVYVVGRDPRSPYMDVRLNVSTTTTSRRHFAVGIKEIDGNPMLVIQDLNSENGTYIYASRGLFKGESITEDTNSSPHPTHSEQNMTPQTESIIRNMLRMEINADGQHELKISSEGIQQGIGYIPLRPIFFVAENMLQKPQGQEIAIKFNTFNGDSDHAYTMIRRRDSNGSYEYILRGIPGFSPEAEYQIDNPESIFLRIKHNGRFSEFTWGLINGRVTITPDNKPHVPFKKGIAHDDDGQPHALGSPIMDLSSFSIS